MGEPLVMAMARLGCIDVARIAARRRDDCERERRADVRVSRIVGDPRITLLIVDLVDQCIRRVTRYLKGDDAAATASRPFRNGCTVYDHLKFWPATHSCCHAYLVLLLNYRCARSE